MRVSVCSVCVSVHVCVVFRGLCLIQTRPIIRFLTVSHLLIFLSVVFDIIHNAMRLNKMSNSSRKTSHDIKDPAVYLTVHMGSFILRSLNPS